MIKSNIPKPPALGQHGNVLIHEGTNVTHIWYFNDQGRATAETLYETAKSLTASTTLSRATAYRIIARHTKRYWLIDYRDPSHPSCLSCIPKEVAADYTPPPTGNPNFNDGIYQQQIALKRRKHKR